MVHALCALVLLTTNFQEAQAPALTTALAVRALTPAEAAAKRPVKLRGVVTHATILDDKAPLGDCFVQDATAGIYVGESALSVGVSAGDEVEIEGVSDPGTFAPMVVPTAIRKLGRAALPDPEPFNLAAQDSRWLDGQYVQVVAHARSLGKLGPFTTMAVVTSAGFGELRIPGRHEDALQPLVGRTVRVRGVCVPKHDKRQMLGPMRIYVQSPDRVGVAPGPRPMDKPAPIAEFVKGFSAVPHPSTRPVALAGTVTARINSTHLFLQDGTAGVLVTTSEPTDTAAGENIEASGFLSIEGPRLLLLHASLKRLGAGQAPPTMALTTPNFDGQTFGRLVRVEGVVEEAVRRDGTFLINVRDGPVQFQAVLEVAELPAEIARLEAGTRVALTGVAHVQALSDMGQPLEPRLYLRSAADISVLALPPQPSWWTTARVLFLGLVFVVIIAVGGFWVWLLRRQVRKQTALISAQFEREARLSDSLRQVRKLEALGRLTAGIAHDFNNLLTVILGNSDLLTRQLEHDPAAKELVAVTCEAGQRAAALTRQLLTFSRRTKVHREALDLNVVVRDAEKLLARVIGENIRLQIECGTQLPLVRADVSLLNQVILNLAANARDAMPRGGTLTIRTSLVKTDKGDTTVRLTVSDTGCGMDENIRLHIFEPFFTTKEIGKGTGLGLATVYGAISMLQGAIQVESALDQGTSFLIDLQLASGDDAEKPVQSSEPQSCQGAVILLVDDDETVRNVCAQAFERSGFKVLIAGSAAAALELARAHSGTIDMLVSDLVMPGLNGREMAAIMRITLPDLHVLFMTGYAPDEVARIVGDLPDVVILAKPFMPFALVTKVQEMLEDNNRTNAAVK